jgi:hypothetical protein
VCTNPLPERNQSVVNRNLVDLIGIEPMTSSMPFNATSIE